MGNSWEGKEEKEWERGGGIRKVEEINENLSRGGERVQSNSEKALPFKWHRSSMRKGLIVLSRREMKPWRVHRPWLTCGILGEKLDFDF